MTYCSVQGCGREHVARGYCNAHYRRMRKHGTIRTEVPITEAAPRGAPLEFLEFALKFPNQRHCLIWPYAQNGHGYGCLRYNGRPRKVYQLVCEITHGKAPKKHEASHSCGVRACCNPHHLLWKSRSENQMDRVLHGTSNRGESHPKSILTIGDVQEIRKLRGVATQAELSARYGVVRQTISEIHRGRNWGWLATEHGRAEQ